MYYHSLLFNKWHHTSNDISNIQWFYRKFQLTHWYQCMNAFPLGYDFSKSLIQHLNQNKTTYILKLNFIKNSCEILINNIINLF